MDIDVFLEKLKKIQKKDLFNPYTDFCKEFDYRDDTSHIFRQMNLREYFKILDRTDSVLVGEAAGHLGCRKTGIAFTDERNLKRVNKIFNINLNFATPSANAKENSAKAIWDSISNLKNPPFLWNIIPLHPFIYPKSLSNRTPNSADYQVVKEVVNYFFENTEFERIFAVGKVALKYLQKLNYKVDYIRHPSFGGTNEFKNLIALNFPPKEKNPHRSLSKFI